MTLSRYSHVARQRSDLGQRLSQLCFNEAGACLPQAGANAPDTRRTPRQKAPNQ